MLEMRPGCEHCDKDLPPELSGAFICSFECTFCAECCDQVFQGKCPNCGGELNPRPARKVELLDEYPASTERIHRPKAV